MILRLRRFAGDYDPPHPTNLDRLFVFNGQYVKEPPLVVPAGQARSLRLPPDHLAIPWHVQTVAARGVTICALPAS